MIKPIAKTANYKTAVLAPYIERWTANGSEYQVEMAAPSGPVSGGRIKQCRKQVFSYLNGIWHLKKVRMFELFIQMSTYLSWTLKLQQKRALKQTA